MFTRLRWILLRLLARLLLVRLVGHGRLGLVETFGGVAQRLAQALGLLTGTRLGLALPILFGDLLGGTGRVGRVHARLAQLLCNLVRVSRVGEFLGELGRDAPVFEPARIFVRRRLIRRAKLVGQSFQLLGQCLPLVGSQIVDGSRQVADGPACRFEIALTQRPGKLRRAVERLRLEPLQTVRERVVGLPVQRGPLVERVGVLVERLGCALHHLVGRGLSRDQFALEFFECFELIGCGDRVVRRGLAHGVDGGLDLGGGLVALHHRHRRPGAVPMQTQLGHEERRGDRGGAQDRPGDPAEARRDRRHRRRVDPGRDAFGVGDRQPRERGVVAARFGRQIDRRRQRVVQPQRVVDLERRPSLTPSPGNGEHRGDDERTRKADRAQHDRVERLADEPADDDSHEQQPRGDRERQSQQPDEPCERSPSSGPAGEPTRRGQRADFSGGHARLYEQRTVGGRKGLALCGCYRPVALPRSRRIRAFVR